MKHMGRFDYYLVREDHFSVLVRESFSSLESFRAETLPNRFFTLSMVADVRRQPATDCTSLISHLAPSPPLKSRNILLARSTVL